LEESRRRARTPDYAGSLTPGESVALSVRADQRSTYLESFNGYIVTPFDGTKVTD
jgi:hypothetical protein